VDVTDDTTPREHASADVAPELFDDLGELEGEQ
jgi:hypothetical protein